jgi:outer membrane autotransporter protein
VDGIEVVEVGGDSDGTFTTGDARIAAGAYDYTLVKGNRAGDKNWYLTSESNNPVNPVVDVNTKTDVSGDRSGSPVTVEQGGQLTVSGNGKVGRQGTGENDTSVLNHDGHLAVEQGGTVLGNIDARDNATLDLGTQGGATSTVSGGVMMEKHASGVFDSVNIGGKGVSLGDESSLTTGKHTFISTTSGNGISMSGNTRLRVNGSHVYSQKNAGIELGGATPQHALPVGIITSQREVELVDATIQGLKAAAIEAKSGLNTIDVTGNSQLLSGNHTLLDTAKAATVALTMSDAQQGDIINQGVSHVVLNQGAHLTGAMQNVTDTQLASGSEWDLTGDSTLTQGLTNAGVVSIAHGGQVGTNLTVDGNYTAQNGHLIMNTRLGDDNSLTDKLVVKGNTRGNTLVTINNAGGTGAKTVDGIEVVSVGGQSDGTFVSTGRITAGEFDYTLARGAGDEAKNWYLSSQLTGPAPGPQPVKVDKDVQPGTRWHLQGATQVNGNMRNSGDVSVATGQTTPGNTLTVNGNYIGNNGLLDFNSRLEGDASLTDKLVVKGDTSGRTQVQVNNLGGTGAKTLNGIELIDVGGKSDGDFISTGRITAGAYDYTLQRGMGQNNKNWYLDSELTTTPPQPGPTPVIHHIVRPEAGTYSANMQASNTLFAMDLQDRTSTEAGARHSNGLWLRQQGGYNRFHDNSGQLTVTSNRYVAQLGSDLLRWSSNGTDQTVFGLMAGYGSSHSQSSSQVSGYLSKGSVQGYSTGAYWTWRANAAEQTGLYTDSWLQYNWFNNDVNGERIAAEHYKSSGASASLELGDAILLGTSGSRSEMTRFFIEPHAQAIWMGVKADRHTEANGTTVKSEGENNLQTHLGMRAYLEKWFDSGVGYKPYVDINWIHNTRAFGAKMNGVSGTVEGARNVGEMGIGIEGNVSRSLALTASVSQQLGAQGYSDTSGELGMKYTF